MHRLLVDYTEILGRSSEKMIHSIIAVIYYPSE